MQQTRPIFSSHFQRKRTDKSHKTRSLIKRHRQIIDICRLQETKITEHFDKTTLHGNRLITIPSNSQHYSNGFILNKKWKN